MIETIRRALDAKGNLRVPARDLRAGGPLCRRPDAFRGDRRDDRNRTRIQDRVPRLDAGSRERGLDREDRVLLERGRGGRFASHGGLCGSGLKSDTGRQTRQTNSCVSALVPGARTASWKRRRNQWLFPDPVGRLVFDRGARHPDNGMISYPRGCDRIGFFPSIGAGIRGRPSCLVSAAPVPCLGSSGANSGSGAYLQVNAPSEDRNPHAEH